MRAFRDAPGQGILIAMSRLAFFCVAAALLTVYVVWTQFHDGETDNAGRPTVEQQAR
ncbi:hypothetical protein F8B43_4929 [Methylorubrum populi]|uniref:Uncharacterized protein n=1 Tax=Methylorubrum populi TaxID=223967 RepID=A0A833N1R5_9HYPH|nr:hypothetical protein F8B43_4929 [Methylorubrum populi]